jgi:tetratricopeptide (TPR) repeat protein
MSLWFKNVDPMDIVKYIYPYVILLDFFWQRWLVIDPRTMAQERFLPNRRLVPVDLTNSIMLLSNICHVEHDECDEEDGLEKVIASSSAWPFATCKHRDWGYDPTFGLRHYRDDEVHCDCPGDNIMHMCCDQALLRIARGQLDESVAWYSKAVQITPLNDCEARLQATAFCSLGIFLSSHLKQNLPHKFMKNDSKAVLLFKVGAIALKSPYCMYFYRHALAHGQGGVKENRARSIHYLNLAGAERVGEAFYELGKIHEEMGTSNGASGSVAFNMISAAEEFFDAAREAYTFEADTTEAPPAPQVPPTGEAETFDHGDCRDADYDAKGQRLNPPTVDPHPPPGVWTLWGATIQSLPDFIHIIFVAAKFYFAAREAYTIEADTSEALPAPHVPPTGEAETFDHGYCRDAEGQPLIPTTVDPQPRRVSHIPPPGAWTPWLATIQSLLDTEGMDTLESSLSSAL